MVSFVHICVYIRLDPFRFWFLSFYYLVIDQKTSQIPHSGTDVGVRSSFMFAFEEILC